MVMGRSIHGLDIGHGGTGIDPPSVFGSDDEWEAFYWKMREFASTDAGAARWVERARRVLQDRGVPVKTS
jgi:hypothetical protein